MKKIIFTLILFVLFPTSVLAWDDCPYNNTDCSFPGECSRYVDTDNDAICDHSQSAPDDRNNTSMDTQSTTDTQLTEEEIENIQRTETEVDIPHTPDATDKQSTKTYHLLPITLLLIVLYFVTFISSKKKIISLVNHRKIWNLLLLISFLISGILGILLIIRINFGTIITLPFNILFWHVEIGTAMFVICVLHIIERWQYFKNLLKFKK